MLQIDAQQPDGFPTRAWSLIGVRPRLRDENKPLTITTIRESRRSSQSRAERVMPSCPRLTAN